MSPKSRQINTRIVELLQDGRSQVEIAKILEISFQAVSMRIKKYCLNHYL